MCINNEGACNDCGRDFEVDLIAGSACPSDDCPSKENPSQPVSSAQYPESLVHRNQYLERENANLKSFLQDLSANKDEYSNQLRLENKTLMEMLNRQDDDSRIWVYQGDGYDAIRSMSNDLPVLIRAAELRHLITYGETNAPDVTSAPIVPKQLNGIIAALAKLEDVISQLHTGFLECKKCGAKEETIDFECTMGLEDLRDLLRAELEVK